jgi:hypothetical protein
MPAPATLRRREGIGRLMRSTAALSRVPRPVEGAVSVRGWAGGIVRSAIAKADVLGLPSEMVPSTVVVAVSENKGNGQNEENDAGNE